MPLHLVTELPEADTDFDDWCLQQSGCAERSPVYFCYAVARDFLSTPRRHQLLQLGNEQGIDGWYRLNWSDLGQEYPDCDFTQITPGFYRDTDANDELLFITPTQALRFHTTEWQCLQQVYHFAESRLALLDLFSNDNRL